MKDNKYENNICNQIPNMIIFYKICSIYQDNVLIRNENHIQNACKVIFGPLFQYSNETLNYLKPSGLKSAFREKAKSCHPDLAKVIGLSENELNKRFKEATEAYNLLLDNIIVNGKLDDIKNNYNDFKMNDFYYSGKMPNKVLRFGKYLFYKKIISWNSLIKAITWQYKTRPRIGQLCTDCNLLTHEKIISIIKDIKYNEKFGEAAIRKGYISIEEFNKILRKQLNFNLPLGKYFIEKSIFSLHQLSKHLYEQKVHNIRMIKIKN